jgi:hypothetical protein
VVCWSASGPTLAVNYPGFVFRTLRDDGHASELLLADTGLTIDFLQDPTIRCEATQVHRLIENAIRLTGDPHLGLRLARRYEPSFVGLPAYAAMNAATLGDALKVIDHYFSMTFPNIDFTFPDTDAQLAPGEVAIRMCPKFTLGHIDYFISCSILVACERLLQAALRVDRVALRAETVVAEPEDWETVATELGLPILFNAPDIRLVVENRLLELPLPGADPINHARLLQLCTRLGCRSEVGIFRARSAPAVGSIRHLVSQARGSGP